VFRGVCCYCEAKGEFFGVPGEFDVEHFKPKSRFPDIAHEWTNLYYCCGWCNRNKGAVVLDFKPGLYFPDPCKEDLYDKHLKFDREDLVAVTDSGQFVLDLLFLNERKPRIFRTKRREMQDQIEKLQSLLAVASANQGLQETLDYLKRTFIDQFLPLPAAR
jgi:hypothetical protein